MYQVGQPGLSTIRSNNSGVRAFGTQVGDGNTAGNVLRTPLQDIWRESNELTLVERSQSARQAIFDCLRFESCSFTNRSTVLKLPYLCAILLLLAHPGASVASAPLNSKWFQSYCRAALESDPNVARVYVKNALDVLNKTLNQTPLTERERMAIASAIRYLALIEHLELRKAS